MSKPSKPTRIPLQTFLRGRSHRRWTYTAITLMVALLLMWADHAGLLLESGGDLQRYDGRTFNVIRVIDGDTLDIDVPDGGHPTTRIRLWGVDTPEKAMTDPPRPAEPYAEEATAFTRSHVLGREVRLILEPHRTRGDYGRLLAFVELSDGSLLNESILRAGLSRADARWSHRYLQRFEAAERAARDAQIGLWSP